MTFTLTFYWWYVPLAMMVASFVALYLGEKQPGFLGGMNHALFAIAMWIGAAAACLAGWLA